MVLSYVLHNIDDCHPFPALKINMYCRCEYFDLCSQERNEDSDSFFLSSQFQDRMHSFVHRYERWLTTTEMQQQCHPWASFKPLQDETVACTSSV